MADATCSIDGCGRRARSRGWCEPHYRRWIRNGDPLGKWQSPEIRFWNKIQKTPTCWIWTAAKDENGYGYFSVGSGKTTLAHRFAYTAACGAIPAGLKVDHRCHNPSCVNPAHLRLATNKQNGEHRLGAIATNTSGIRGVTFYKKTQKWRAQVGHEGKFIHVGYFDTSAAAESAAIAKRNELFTHNDQDRIA